MAKDLHSVKIGATAVDEKARLSDLDRLRSDIKKWAEQRELWFDCAFHTPFIYRDERPETSEVLLLTTEGPLASAIGITSYGSGNIEPQFTELLATHGFLFEAENHYTISLYPEDQELLEEYRTLDRWRWIQRLANERLCEIHTEVFEHFAKQPDDLRRLSWRQFEELLDAVFKNQGFVTELGPGGNDGGVDLRLYQSEGVPELVALVQAKRYTNRPITREPVAALFGVAALEGAPQGIVATTSRFLPSAKAFADATSQHLDLPRIELADSAKVGGWCAEVAQYLNQFFSRGGIAAPLAISRQTPTKLTGKIVVATDGYNMTSNSFAVIEADFPHEIILRPIGSKSDTPRAQVGCEMPDITAPPTWIRETRFTAFKRPSRLSNEPQFRGCRKLFSLWNGKPMNFNYFD